MRRLSSPRGGVEEVLRRLRSQVRRTVVEMFQEFAGAFPSPSNGNKMSRGLIAGRSGVGGGGIELEKRGGESEWQWAGFLNAHSQGQSLEPLCAGNTKRTAPRPADNGPMGVLRQLNFQRAAPSNRPGRHRDTL